MIGGGKVMSSNLLSNLPLTIAITGSTGLIGSKLVNILSEQGFTVSQPRKERLLEDLKEFNPAYIINCIGAGMDIRKGHSDEEIWKANFETPLELLKLAEKLGSKIISIGSILEKVNSFSSPYIDSKRKFTEEITHSHSQNFKAVSILTPIVFGLEQEHVFVTEIINAGISKVPMNLESPNAIREFIHVSDLARVIMKLLNSDTFPFSHFEVGTGLGYRLSDLCESVLQGFMMPTWVFSPRKDRTNEYTVIANVDYSIKELGIPISYELAEWLRSRITKV